MDSFGLIEAETAAAAAESGRTRKRDSLFLTARLTLAGKPTAHDVRVRNLSEGGLMAEYDPIVEPDTTVTLEMRGLGEMTGRVAWCTRGRLGIAFDQPIDPSRARKPVGVGKPAPGYTKPLIVPGRRR